VHADVGRQRAVPLGGSIGSPSRVSTRPSTRASSGTLIVRNEMRGSSLAARSLASVLIATWAASPEPRLRRSTSTNAAHAVAYCLFFSRQSATLSKVDVAGSLR
jgi:hypothetical protein